MRISIDPGLSGTGLAFWSEDDWDEKVRPYHTVNISASRTKYPDWTDKLKYITEEVIEYFDYDDIETSQIYCEYPQFMQSETGKMVARRGDLVKLTTLAGALFGAATYHEIPFAFIPVNVWKGQLPKDITVKRIKLQLDDPVYPTSHVWDAVGIGLYAKGYF